MYKNKKIICVIPARLHSSRFPKKVLKHLNGKPLLQWVYEAASGCNFFDEILFAVDAIETQKLVESFGGVALMTSEGCLNGTMRMIEVQTRYHLQADVWVNWQADEPFLSQAMMEDLLQSIDSSHRDIWTLRKKITEPQEHTDPSVVKVVVDHEEQALYFSRYALPYERDGVRAERYKHIGIYAFTSEALESIEKMPPCPLELSEALEQLRFLYYGMKIFAHETFHSTLGIDLPEHLEMAEQWVKTSLTQNLISF